MSVDLPPHGERLQVLVCDQGVLLAVSLEIVVYPVLIHGMQECDLFLAIEATKRELYLTGFLREKLGGIACASL
jgi:hypothetical protein